MSHNARDAYKPQPSTKIIRVPRREEPNDEIQNDVSTTSSKAPIKTENTQNLPGPQTETKWTLQKKIILGVIIGVVVLLIILIIILAVVLTRRNASSSGSSNTVVNYVFWSFDTGTNDTFGTYNGQLINGATYCNRSNTQPYLGQGTALSFTSSLNQSFQVTSPFLSLAYTSFTVEAWIYPTTVTGDNGIMGQCQCSSCSNLCFFFLVRSSRLYAGFSLNDINGLTVLSVNTWYHIAFVYDSANQQQILYVNGVQDNIKYGATSLQVTNATFTIGMATFFPSIAFFNGFIDNVKIQTSARSSAEILIAASLTAYYSFDLPSPTNDNGPNGLNGTSQNTASVTGRVNQAMRFTGSSSYFQAYGFYQAGFGVYSNRAFSISLWYSAAAYTSSTIVQMSTAQTGGSCFNMLGIWSYTGNAAQFVAQGYAWPAIYGPPVTLNTWTHISWTFTLTNGYRLYVNGIYYATTGYYSHGASGSISWIEIGYAFSCSSAYISNAGFQGSIDEVYLHNRELTAAEVYSLANP